MAPWCKNQGVFRLYGHRLCGVISECSSLTARTGKWEHTTNGPGTIRIIVLALFYRGAELADRELIA